MSATRLLVLGVVRTYGTAHGYLVRNELVSWGADEWANVKWGSVYHALKQLTKEGLLSATDVDKWPGRTDYALTEAGHAEFLRLLRDALQHPEPRPDTLAAGLAFLPALPRAEAIDLLRERCVELEKGRDAIAPYVDQADEWREFGAEHVPELFRLWTHSADSSLTWTRGLIERLRDGAYVMVDDDPRAFGAPGSRSPKSG